ncbi:pyridoxamine 5'-phosphate oxidase family protein [Clostridium sp. BSD9I1]|uniref:pyridoxamine 5'-phosphate oxidase family protein n=1 Tax=Clostridium sp. BSD9I1 TaxID=2003589 RepID=UPI001646B42F|nr:pyridoxamine 5'-phosphate oxidase family protein [Clostridium sp. BSD9I1]
MIPEKMKEVLKYEGVVAVATQGEGKAHLVNTWNSYIQVIDDNKVLFPVGFMNETEANIEKNNKVEVTMGSREVQGFQGQGTGFLINGTMCFIKEGKEFDLIKQKYPWARAAGEIRINSIKQTL